MVLLSGLAGIFSAQVNSITFPCSAPPVIDGKKSGSEWDAADTVRITLSSGKTIKVYFMKDRDNLYFLYAGNLESQIHFPELLIDVNNAKSTTWQADDWWFHVSATDCENQGAPGVYNNCQLVQPGWEAEQNILQGQPITDTVEIKIPFTKIGLSPGGAYSIGICFSTFNISGSSAVPSWPSSAVKGNPSTWASAWLQLCEPVSLGIKEDLANHKFKIYPNPSNGNFTIEMQAASTSVNYVITDVYGKIINGGQTEPTHVTYINSSLEKGIYFFSLIENGKFTRTEKLIIY
ncbi:MAG: T9SS type A sorting domain-containing protein [Flavobacteriia bacterium]|nr:T9SS type A sorting domain-containing protein [Flavobacteriia bacterium]